MSRLVAGRPQFTTMRWLRVENSKARQPACASALNDIGGGGDRVGEHSSAGLFDSADNDDDDSGFDNDDGGFDGGGDSDVA